MEELYDMIVDEGIATESELSLVCSINGTSQRTLEDVLYSRTGYRSLEQYREMYDV